MLILDSKVGYYKSTNAGTLISLFGKSRAKQAQLTLLQGPPSLPPFLSRHSHSRTNSLNASHLGTVYHSFECHQQNNKNAMK